MEINNCRTPALFCRYFFSILVVFRLSSIRAIVSMLKSCLSLIPHDSILNSCLLIRCLVYCLRPLLLVLLLFSIQIVKFASFLWFFEFRFASNSNNSSGIGGDGGNHNSSLPVNCEPYWFRMSNYNSIGINSHFQHMLLLLVAVAVAEVFFLSFLCVFVKPSPLFFLSILRIVSLMMAFSGVCWYHCYSLCVLYAAIQ